MKAFTRSAYGSPEVLRWTEVQSLEPGPGEVRLAIGAASINAADLHLLYGRPLPARLAFGLFRPKNPRVDAVIGGDMGNTFAAVIRGKSLLAMSSQEDLSAVAEWLESGAIRPLVGARFPMSEVPQAMQRFEEGGVGGKIVVVNEMN